ncbi:anti-sigma factor family protein [Aneurinibacillus tyrosinisolvens]|uniref:anti-sigma factor family protein n=1 Tax=Aneurinibacillus tyrosinisolvens TaxID=1443435 RepID=UPI000A95E0F0|nr:zf-HC2 domain-containing protein [Aneurinibacillus tyrosinisolvens]
MNHIEDLLSGYIDGELTEEQRMLVEHHLRRCEECRETVDEISAIRNQVYTTYQSIEIPSFLEQKIISSIFSEPVYGKLRAYIPAAAILSVVFFVLILSSATFVSIGFISSLASAFIGIVHIVPLLVSSVPLLLQAVVGTALVLMLLSLWSLRRLLVIKATG